MKSKKTQIVAGVVSGALLVVVVVATLVAVNVNRGGFGHLTDGTLRLAKDCSFSGQNRAEATVRYRGYVDGGSENVGATIEVRDVRTDKSLGSTIVRRNVSGSFNLTIPVTFDWDSQKATGRVTCYVSMNNGWH